MPVARRDALLVRVLGLRGTALLAEGVREGEGVEFGLAIGMD